MKLNLLNGDVEAVSDRSEPTFKPQLSRDGKWLAYGALHDGKTGLRLRNLESGDDRWLLQDIGFNGLETWASRDMLPGFSFTAASDAVVIAFGGKMRRVSVADGGTTEIPFHVRVEMEVAPRFAPSVTIDQGPVTARVAKGAVVSPDGNQFAFSAFGRLYKMAIADQTPRKLTTQTDFGEFHPAWSPDGTWLAYVTWSATEGGAIWKVRADSAGPAQKLTADNAYYRNPVWSRDGQTILAVSAPKNLRLENARGPLAAAEQIVSLASNGGKPVAISPAGGVVRVHFSEDAQRFYAYSPRLGLSSWKLDGSDQKTHLRVTGSASAASFPAMADDILLSPDGRQALAAVENQLYLIDMSSVLAEQPSINVYAPDSAYTKITMLGADHFSWANGSTLAWSAGSTLYRKTAENGGVVEVEASVQLPRQTPSGTIVLRGARIITMEGDRVIGNGDILIDGNRILDVGERGSVNIPETATVIDVHNKTIMPGIVDIHAHWQLKQSVLDLEDHNAYANLAYGVTTIRDPQTFTADIFVYSDAVATGEMIGPRIFSTGRGVFFFNNFQSYEQVYAVLARYKTKYRTHLVKAYLAGSREVRQWVIQACRELDLLVTTEGGSDSKMDLTFALDGFSGIEHSIPIVPLNEDIVQLYAQSGISYTPTLLVSFGGPFAVDHFTANGIGLKDQKLHRFMPANLIEQRIARTRFVAPEDHIFPEVASGANEILEAGGNIGLGGHGEMQGLQVHWEMSALSAGGMSNHNVLRVATLGSAKAIGLDTDIGSIEAGKLADLVVMDNNPLDDIAHTNSISKVMVNGVLYDAETLAQQWPDKKNLPAPWWQSKQIHIKETP
jgi:imidazolonepropionase-like amidohydrolase/WD40 repeat protein